MEPGALAIQCHGRAAELGAGCPEFEIFAAPAAAQAETRMQYPPHQPPVLLPPIKAPSFRGIRKDVTLLDDLCLIPVRLILSQRSCTLLLPLYTLKKKIKKNPLHELYLRLPLCLGQQAQDSGEADKTLPPGRTAKAY